MKTPLFAVVLVAFFVAAGTIGYFIFAPGQSLAPENGSVRQPDENGNSPEETNGNDSPSACIMIYAPVCGVDGTTYSNSCLAGVANVGVAHEGVCSGTPQDSQTTDGSESVPVVKEFTLTARQWRFDPATITVSQGDTVKLHITSIDVTHGFSLPDFNVNVNLSPNTTTSVEFVADTTGTFSFFCSVFCGTGHADMRGTLVVE